MCRMENGNEYLFQAKDAVSVVLMTLVYTQGGISTLIISVMFRMTWLSGFNICGKAQAVMLLKCQRKRKNEVYSNEKSNAELLWGIFNVRRFFSLESFVDTACAESVEIRIVLLEEQYCRMTMLLICTAFSW